MTAPRPTYTMTADEYKKYNAMKRLAFNLTLLVAELGDHASNDTERGHHTYNNLYNEGFLIGRAAGYAAAVKLLTERLAKILPARIG